MFAQRNLPEKLSLASLDHYLERGWYRTGQSLFTTHFLMFGFKKFFSAIWVRLPLEGFSFSKRNRKLLRNNCSRFRWVFQEAKMEREAEALYQQYSSHFPEKLSPTLQDALLEGNNSNIFRTMEFLVWDGEQLVAASYFDLGKNSLSSILGFYHPDYAQYSLGYFTMLMEVVYALDHGYRFFYPGYVVPGYSRFDYKLRVGPMEYFDLYTDGWLPYAQLTPEQMPFAKMQHNLLALSALLQQHEIPHEIRLNGLFHLNLMQDEQYLDYPLMLHLGQNNDFFNENQDIIVFNPRINQFQLLLCTWAGGFYALNYEGNNEEEEEDFLSGVPIQVRHVRATWELISDIATSLKAVGY